MEQVSENSPGQNRLRAFVDTLSDISDATFHDALGKLAELGEVSGAVGVELIVEVAGRLIARGELGERVQADRVHAILRRISLREAALSSLAIRAREFSPGLRNSIAGFLAPTQRRLLLGARRSDHTVEIRPEDPAGQPTEQATHAEAVPKLFSDAPERYNPFSTVVLFAGPFQDANKQMLSVGGFGPIVWSSLENLRQDLEQNGDICACLVDGSALQNLDKESQRQLFLLLGAYSTFLWVRVENRHLQLSSVEIRECLRSARCMREEVPSSLLSIQPDAILRDPEVQDIDAASKALRTREQAEFIPGELSADEAKILMAAVKIHASELHISGRAELKSLEARFLAGGRSPARIAVLRINQGGYPVVAKIDKKASVLDEMRRFRTFIEPWDSELRPKLHFHGPAAVLLFGLVSDDRDRYRPAEMLSQRLETLWNDQIFSLKSSQDLLRDAEALAEGVERTARKLGELNSLRPPESDLPPIGNPSISIFERLAESGLDWGIGSFASVALSKAAERLSKLHCAATIHGDVHLKNVLLRDDRHPHLIDYAGSGPGHPCVDLVRFELALLLGPLRQTTSEEQCAEYQKVFTFGELPYSELERRFGELHRCHLNVVCLRGCVAARDQVLAVLKSHNGTAEDYYAVKYLVAWQNLVMMERHTGLARAIISTLGREIALW